MPTQEEHPIYTILSVTHSVNYNKTHKSRLKQCHDIKCDLYKISSKKPKII